MGFKKREWELLALDGAMTPPSVKWSGGQGIVEGKSKAEAFFKHWFILLYSSCRPLQICLFLSGNSVAVIIFGIWSSFLSVLAG